MPSVRKCGLTIVEYCSYPNADFELVAEIEIPGSSLAKRPLCVEEDATDI
jgi:hypothetical protein